MTNYAIVDTSRSIFQASDWQFKATGCHKTHKSNQKLVKRCPKLCRVAMAQGASLLFAAFYLSMLLKNSSEIIPGLKIYQLIPVYL